MASIPVISQYPAGVQILASNQMPQGMQMVMQGSSSRFANLRERQRGHMKVLSAIQITAGSVAMVFQVILLLIGDYVMDIVSSGIWCGVLFIISGILGVVGASKNSRGLVIATMVMSIISAVSVWVIIGFSTVTLVICENSYYCHSAYDALHGLMILTALTEFVASIWTSVLCCKGSCGGPNYAGMTYASQPVYFGSQSTFGNQVVIMPQAGIHAAQPSFVNPHQAYVSQVYMPPGYQTGPVTVQTGVPVQNNGSTISGGPPPYYPQGITNARTS